MREIRDIAVQGYKISSNSWGRVEVVDQVQLAVQDSGGGAISRGRLKKLIARRSTHGYKW